MSKKDILNNLNQRGLITPLFKIKKGIDFFMPLPQI